MWVDIGEILIEMKSEAKGWLLEKDENEKFIPSLVEPIDAPYTVCPSTTRVQGGRGGSSSGKENEVDRVVITIITLTRKIFPFPTDSNDDLGLELDFAKCKIYEVIERNFGSNRK